MKRRYSYKFLWSLGFTMCLMAILLVPIVAIVLGTILELFDITFGLTATWIILLFYLILLSWVWVSNCWKNWALKNVNGSGYYLLLTKIADPQKSFVIKKWSELSRSTRATIVIVVSIVSILAFTSDKFFERKNKEFEQNSLYTEAEVVSIDAYYNRRHVNQQIKYSYFVDSQQYIDSSVPNTGFLVFIEEINGFPIDKNYTFQLAYDPREPKDNKIYFDRPEGETLVNYMELAKIKVKEIYPENIDCGQLVDSVNANLGLRAVATLYNYNKSYWKNKNFNKLKFKILTSKDDYKTIVKKSRTN